MPLRPRRDAETRPAPAFALGILQNQLAGCGEAKARSRLALECARAESGIVAGRATAAGECLAVVAVAGLARQITLLVFLLVGRV